MSLEAIGTDTTGPEPAPGAAAQAVQSPYCREIRSKKYFFLREMPTQESHLRDGSNHCWCRQTMKVYGPDGELTRPSDCVAGRSCYRSLFETE